MRTEYSQRLYRVLEALDPRATTLDLATGDLEGALADASAAAAAGQADRARQLGTVVGAAVAKRDEGAAVHTPRVVPWYSPMGRRAVDGSGSWRGSTASTARQSRHT